ncbi:murein biosynthesis integral membrane protein MurJ [Bdellovibrio bacteriovorus]|uniref:murein biosynthesis integral membrane protein MurJ n=1 Tax=Bdellovibrio bacteriovorus TaxID=959 RepID=UPI0035A6AE43
MASGTLTSRILGLLRDMALGALFERSITDAWTAAFRLPNLFRRLFGEGSLSVSFIPVFMEARAEDLHGPRAQNLMNALYTLLLIFLGTLTLLGIVFTEDILRLLLASDYSLDLTKWELTVRMARIMFGFIFFVCSYAYFMAILNSLGSFGLPALAPALLNVAMLIFTFMPPSWFPQIGDGLAWGVLVGGALQALLLWIALRSRGYLPHFRLHNTFTEDTKKVLRNMLPGLIGMGLLQFSTLVNLYFASSLAEGSISYIYWADRLLELPLSLISVSLGAALLPTLSEYVAQKNQVQFQQTAQESFLMNLFLALPAAVGLFVLAEPIIEVLFLRGRFTVADVAATSGVLKIYALSLLMISCSRVLMPLYYAIKNTWFPAVVSGLCLSVHILLAPLLMAHSGLNGLILSGMIGAFLNAVVLLAGLRVWNLQFQWGRVGKSLGKILVACAALAVSLQSYSLLMALTGRGLQVLALFVTIFIAVLVYFAFAAILRCEQVSRIRPSSRP